MVIGLQIGKLHREAKSAPPPPAVADSEKPGLFRVNFKELFSKNFKKHLSPLRVNGTALRFKCNSVRLCDKLRSVTLLHCSL